MGTTLTTNMPEGEQPKKKYVHKKYTYRGVALEELLDKSGTELMEMFNARQRRRLSRGLNIKVRNFIRKLRKAKTAAPYNEKHFATVEIKPEMIGHYLGEFSISY